MNIDEPYLTSPYLSSAQAAEELGVTRHQIAMLVKNGEVHAARLGGSLLVDPYSLRLYKQLRRGKGRPLSPDVAWAALWLLSGLDAPWLTYQQRRRLPEKLRVISAEDLAWQARKRADLRAFRANPADFKAIAEHLVLSGKSTDRPDIFGMPKNERELEGYADANTLRELNELFDLHEDISGNVLIHSATSTPWAQDGFDNATHRQMPVGVVAADLASSLDPREARAGLAALDILLGGLRRM